MDRTVLRGILGALPRLSLSLTVLLIIGAIAQPALGVLQILLIGRIVGQVPGLVAGEVRWLDTLLPFAAVLVSSQAVATGNEIVRWRLGQRLNHDLDDRVMNYMLTGHGIGHLEDPSVTNLASEASDGLAAGRWRPAAVPGALASLVSSTISIVAALSLLVWHNVWIGAIIATITLWTFPTIIGYLYSVTMGMVEAVGAEQYRRIDYEREAALSPASAKEVRLFGFGPWVLERWERRLHTVLALDIHSMKRLPRRVVAASLTLLLSIAATFVWLGVQASSGHLGLAGAIILAQALLIPLSLAEPIGQSWLDLMQSARPVRAILTLEGSRASTPVDELFIRSRPVPSDIGTIRFEGVVFSYPGSTDAVLNGINLEIPCRTSVAIVGLNGTGKTTLVKLLCRFYEPTSGRITADGVDIRSYDASHWQRRVAAIFQDFARYPVSVKENISLGCLGAGTDDINRAAERAGARALVDGLEHGWGTVLERGFDRSADLSGGQWQRIALARAILAGNSGANMLLLDEPAANLDVRAEAELNERFLELTEGFTTIIVSHRMSTVRLAEQICVISDGRVSEVGTHDELVSSRGAYARMFVVQAKRFGVAR